MFYFELEFYTTASGQAAVLFDSRNDTNNGYQIYLTSVDIQLYTYNNRHIILNSSYLLNQWNNVKLYSDTSKIVLELNGEKIEDHASTSRYMARTWVNFHQRVLAPMEMEGTKEKYAKEAAKKAQNSNQFSGGGNGGNGGGSNWNNNNSNGGGNSGGGSEPAFDEDIPF